MGTATAPQKGREILKWKDEEGHRGYFQPFIIDNIPVNLWGRNVLHDMGAVLAMQPTQRMIILPSDQEQVNNLIRTFDDWSIFSCSTTSQFDNHYPENKICEFFKIHPVIFPSTVKNRPLRLVFLMVVLRDTLWSFQRARWRK